MTSTLSPERIDSSLDAALEYLRTELGADAMEVFLANPVDGELFLSACCGEFQAALCERVRFAPGRGYPGLVAAEGRPIITRDLGGDRRFLRKRVQRLGVHSYVCVPLWDEDSVLGTLNAAWRSSSAPVDSALRLMEMAALPISTAVRAAMGSVRRKICEAFAADGAEADLDACLRALLCHMQEVAHAPVGSIVVHDAGRGSIFQHVEAPTEVTLECPVQEAGDLERCVCLRDGRSVMLCGSRGRWPPSCRLTGIQLSCAVGLPLISSGRLLGVVKLSYPGSPPRPVSRYFGLLTAMAQTAALQIQLRNTPRRENHGSQTPRIHRVQHEAAEILHAEPISRLKILCFGGFELQRGGRPVTPDMFRRGKALVLLKILLLQGGRSVHRDVLTDLLWPDADAAGGPNRLHGVVHSLREVLEPEGSRRQWRILSSRADQYCLHLDPPHEVDLYKFQGRIKRGREAEQDPRRTADAMACFAEACDLYRGDLYEEEPYAQWCWADRECLREHYLEALKSLGRLCAAHGEPDRSIDYWRRILRLDPLREDAHVGLMQVLYNAGRRTEALAQYESCATVMRAELGAEPLVETRLLRQAIMEVARS